MNHHRNVVFVYYCRACSRYSGDSAAARSIFRKNHENCKRNIFWGIIKQDFVKWVMLMRSEAKKIYEELQAGKTISKIDGNQKTKARVHKIFLYRKLVDALIDDMQKGNYTF